MGRWMDVGFPSPFFFVGRAWLFQPLFFSFSPIIIITITFTTINTIIFTFHPTVSWRPRHCSHAVAAGPHIDNNNIYFFPSFDLLLLFFHFIVAIYPCFFCFFSPHPFFSLSACIAWGEGSCLKCGIECNPYGLVPLLFIRRVWERHAARVVGSWAAPTHLYFFPNSGSNESGSVPLTTPTHIFSSTYLFIIIYSYSSSSPTFLPLCSDIIIINIIRIIENLTYLLSPSPPLPPSPLESRGHGSLEVNRRIKII